MSACYDLVSLILLHFPSPCLCFLLVGLTELQYPRCKQACDSTEPLSVYANSALLIPRERVGFYGLTGQVFSYCMISIQSHVGGGPVDP